MFATILFKRARVISFNFKKTCPLAIDWTATCQILQYYRDARRRMLSVDTKFQEALPIMADASTGY